jgi:hypothetical protein
MVSEQSYMSVCQEMVPSSQQPPVGHPFLAVGGLSGSTSHPSTWLATFQFHVGGTPVPPPGAHKQPVPRSGGKIALALENS